MATRVFTDPMGFHRAVIAAIVEGRNQSVDNGSREVAKAFVGAPAKLGPGRVILEGVVRLTPRATGEAQNSYGVSINGAPAGHNPGKRDPARAVVRRLGRAIDRAKKRPRIVVFATAPHIRALELGTERMAPRMMFRRAAKAVRAVGG